MTGECRFQGMVNGRRVCYAPRRPLFCMGWMALKCAVGDFLKSTLSKRRFF